MTERRDEEDEEVEPIEAQLVEGSKPNVGVGGGWGEMSRNPTLMSEYQGNRDTVWGEDPVYR